MPAHNDGWRCSLNYLKADLPAKNLTLYLMEGRMQVQNRLVRAARLATLLQVAADATAWAVKVRGAESAAELESERGAAGETGGVRCAASTYMSASNTDGRPPASKKQPTCSC